jgi:2-phospho-L-lactate guanylyltransferase
MRTSAGVVVPIRSFRFGKARLAAALDDDARIALARRMAEAVVAAAGARPVVIISSDEEVATWCDHRGLVRVDDPGSLDAAARAGRAWVRQQGWARVVVVHGDLPYATTLDDVAGDGDAPVAVLVPDHRRDGTPVCAIPAGADFEFSYGPGSFARHLAEAARVGLEARIVNDESLGFDVDTPDDLAQLESPTP